MIVCLKQIAPCRAVNYGALCGLPRFYCAGYCDSLVHQCALIFSNIQNFLLHNSLLFVKKLLSLQCLIFIRFAHPRAASN